MDAYIFGAGASRAGRLPDLSELLGAVVRGGSLSCPSCGRPGLEPVVVAPSVLKSYSIPRLERVWLEALDALRRAEAFYFIGYSLSAVDVGVIDLVKRAILLQSSPPRVCAIGYHSEEVDFEDNRAVLKVPMVRRYVEVFGPDVEFYLGGFTGEIPGANQFRPAPIT